MLVMAWIIPIGIMKNNEIKRAMKNAHQVRWVSYARTEARAMPRTDRKVAPNHQLGTSLYLRIILVCTSGSSPRDRRVRSQISWPWNKMVWVTKAIIAAKDNP